MAKSPECVDCITSGVTNWRPVTGVRVKRCATHKRTKGKAAKQRRQATNRTNTYGITPEDHAELLAFQNGLCAICGPVTGNRGATKALSVDHDHKCCPTGSVPVSCGRCVRGLLCSTCNTFIGRIRDSVYVALRMVAYLLDPPWKKILRKRGVK